MIQPPKNDHGQNGTPRREVLERAVKRLEAAAIPSPRKNAEWMLCEVLDCRRLSLYAGADEPVSTEALGLFDRMVERRLQHEPLQYILGYTDFFGLRIGVNPAVLIPRPETEQLVEVVLNLLSGAEAPRILDVGTGSGCIAIALASKRPDALVWACDVDEKALETARQNASINQVAVQFYRSDALADAFAEDSPKSLDVLVSNPPYVAAEELTSLPLEVREHEPHQALFAHRDDALIFYKRLAHHALSLLNPGGLLAMETHSELGTDARDVLSRAGFQGVELRRDYAGHFRILIGRRPSS